MPSFAAPQRRPAGIPFDNQVRAAREKQELAAGHKNRTGHLFVDAIKGRIGKRTIDSDRLRTFSDPLAKSREATLEEEASNATLTSREREVLRHLAEGRSNKEVGALLGISTRTVETHRARLMRKLRLRSMNHLVRYAIRHRIISA